MRHSGFFGPLILVAVFACPLASSQTATAPSAPPPATKNGGDFSNAVLPEAMPKGAILVKGAWASASDSVTPVPEGGSVAKNTFSDPYFGMTYSLPTDWAEKYKGPPPSDSGRYVLAAINPTHSFKGPSRGTILITAEDLFFTPLPVNNALELVNYSKDHLQADYRLEMPPTPTKIADHPFTFFAYWSPAAELHWYVFATEIRCHAVNIILTSRDTKLLENLVLDMNKIELPAEAAPTAGTGGGQFPVCMKDYAEGGNVSARVDPVFTEHKFNPVPLRIIIDKEGKVKHVHFLSAFPDQAKVITDALGQWKFKPYRRDGKLVEVETGLIFGRTQRSGPSTAAGSTTE